MDGTNELDRPGTVGGSLPEAGRKELMVTWAAAGAAALLVVVAAVVAGAVAGDPVNDLPWPGPEADAPSSPNPGAFKRLGQLPPKELFVVIDTARGRFRLQRGGEVVHEAPCSAGSGTILVEPGRRVWVFDTPIGERRVIYKQRDPVWTKPDWAFVEEGTLPPENPAARRDDVSLGDYALSLGDGYLIHGTLFQSLLGQPVTHGCIRLGDEDLEYVWRTVGVGTRVFLY